MLTHGCRAGVTMLSSNVAPVFSSRPTLFQKNNPLKQTKEQTLINSLNYQASDGARQIQRSHLLPTNPILSTQHKQCFAFFCFFVLPRRGPSF
jgi:hypothetical protein